MVGTGIPRFVFTPALQKISAGSAEGFLRVDGNSLHKGTEDVETESPVDMRLKMGRSDRHKIAGPHPIPSLALQRKKQTQRRHLFWDVQQGDCGK